LLLRKLRPGSWREGEWRLLDNSLNSWAFPLHHVTHRCDQIAWRLLSQAGKIGARGRGVIVSPIRAELRAMVPNSEIYPRMTTSDANSNVSKTLPVSLTGSRFCRPRFFSALCFQDFARYGGRGGTPVAGGGLALVSKLTFSVAAIAGPIQASSGSGPRANGEERKAIRP
jgi:hypothetical protein